jgi:hypothetical protein
MRRETTTGSAPFSRMKRSSRRAVHSAGAKPGASAKSKRRTSAASTARISCSASARPTQFAGPARERVSAGRRQDDGAAGRRTVAERDVCGGDEPERRAARLGLLAARRCPALWPERAGLRREVARVAVHCRRAVSSRVPHGSKAGAHGTTPGSARSCPRGRRGPRRAAARRPRAGRAACPSGPRAAAGWSRYCLRISVRPCAGAGVRRTSRR